MLKYYLSPVLIFLSVFTFAQSTKNSNQRKILWKQPVEFKVSENETMRLLNFEGAQYDPSKKFLPVYGETFLSPFSNSVTEIKTELINDVYEPLQETALITDASLISSKIEIVSSIGIERKKPILGFAFIPIRKNTVTNSFEKLVSFDIKFSPVKTVSVSNAALRYYAPNSVLGSGTWFKIGVTHDGVYKITSSFLKQLGVDTTNLDPHNINIFGNGGGMLPYLNGTPRADDLVENAIDIIGEPDGHFNNGDYILFYGQSPDHWSFSSGDNKFHHTKNLL